MLPTCAQLAGLWTEPALGLPTDVLDRFGVFCQSALERLAHFCWGPRRSDAFNEDATGMGLPGFGHGPWAAPLARGGCRGLEAQKCHECSGGIEARQVAECGYGGHGHCAQHAAQSLEGFHSWGEAPGCDLL